MKYLIVGGNSLFGKYMIPFLLKKGGEVSATKLSKEIIKINKNIDWYDMDVMDIDRIKEILEIACPDVVYDFAVQNSVGYAWDNPIETVDVNVIGALNMYDAIRDYMQKTNKSVKLIMAGSGEEYGRKSFDKLPIKENEVPNPENIFASSKVCQTQLGQIYHKAYNMPIYILRTFNEIGVGQSERFAISNFCKQFAKAKLQNTDLELHVGDLNIERDFTDVKDLIKAFYAIEVKGRPGEIYNAARSNPISIKNMIEIMKDITGIEARIIVDESRIRPIDTPKFEADVSKIKKDTGWQADIPIRDTIKAMLDYWSNEINVGK